ncbi:32824_t:CDS:2 [Racocetra persica]|uniref:32824_t:CDS:1 n=1 Tax=Racocetra persica TaxID=160502 RepID=A0ACA9KTU0_9GLOM|nr:32824_t:CDS:2 [Racocetra persica]
MYCVLTERKNREGAERRAIRRLSFMVDGSAFMEETIMISIAIFP